MEKLHNRRGNPEYHPYCNSLAALGIYCVAVAYCGYKNIYYKNAYRQFGLIPDMYPATVGYYEDKLLKRVGNSYLYYMPEAMMMNTNPVWSVADHKPVNYFSIETLDGKSYDIPVITDDRTITDTDYLAFATGQNTDKPDYNIYRNRHYYYVIKKLQTIDKKRGSCFLSYDFQRSSIIS